MYYLVIVDDWCSVIPVAWVDTSTRLFQWPPKGMNPTNAIIKCAQVTKSWHKQSYRKIRGPYSTYELARRIEMASINISTSDDAQFSQLESTILPKKRKMKKPKFADNLTDDEGSMPTKPGNQVMLPPSTYLPHIDRQITTEESPRRHRDDQSLLSCKQKTISSTCRTIVQQGNQINRGDQSPLPRTQKEMMSTFKTNSHQSRGIKHDESPQMQIQEPKQYPSINTAQEECQVISNVRCSSQKQEAVYIAKVHTAQQPQLPTIHIPQHKSCHRQLDEIGDYDAFAQNKALCTSTQYDTVSQNRESSPDIFSSQEPPSLDETFFDNANGNSEPANTDAEGESQSPLPESLSPSDDMMQQFDCGICHGTRKAVTSLIQKVDEVLLLLRDKPRDNQPQNLLNLDRLPIFPLTTVADVKAFEADLQTSSATRKQFQFRVSKIGGRTAEKHVRNVLSGILTDEVAMAFTWVQKSKMAVAVLGGPMHDMEMTAIIIGTVLTGEHKCTISRLEDVVQDWLRHAGDRYRYELKKHNIPA